jgi:hypothetical protein
MPECEIHIKLRVAGGDRCVVITKYFYVEDWEGNIV